jgi:hypothetical protein
MQYDLDHKTLETIAQMAGTPKEIAESMFANRAVRRVDAEKVLAAFSEYTGDTWTLDNTTVSLMPTFAAICEKHHLDINALTLQLDKVEEVPFCCFDMMLEYTPVLAVHAAMVLDIISTRIKQHYTLEHVDVALLAKATQS